MKGCSGVSRRARGRGWLAEGLGGVGQPLEQRRGQVEVVDLGDVLAPAVQEVAPAVVQLQVTRAGLVPGLAQEPEVAPVVEVPDQDPGGKRARSPSGDPGTSLPMPVALMTREPSGSPASNASTSPGPVTLASSTPRASSPAQMSPSVVRRPASLSATTIRAGEGSAVSSRTQMAVPAPPAPRHSTWVVRSSRRPGPRRSSRARPAVMGSLAWPSRRPARREMQEISRHRRAYWSSSSNRLPAWRYTSSLWLVTSPPAMPGSPASRATVSR